MFDRVKTIGAPSFNLGEFSIPQVGLGLWKITDKEEFEVSFDAAIKAGYRHFDTAQIYGNEAYLGECIEKSGLNRKDLFITTKVHVKNFGYKRTLRSVEKSLANLKTDYVDLLLLHFPVPLLRGRSWRALEEIKANGKARSIGVSNFTLRHLTRLSQKSSTQPAVNQVELHVFLQQPELVDYCRKQGIAIEAYSPLAHGRKMSEPSIDKIAKKHGKSYAQVMIAWCIDQGFVVLPKSVNPKRLQENIDVFDFSLDKDDKKRLAKLDQSLRTCWDPTRVP